jgi:carboxylesterase type B
MVEIYGGGYTLGDKVNVGNPAGLIARSVEDGNEGVIYVAMNYRLGLFVGILIHYSSIINIIRDGFLGMQM